MQPRRATGQPEASIPSLDLELSHARVFHVTFHSLVIALGYQKRGLCLLKLPYYTYCSALANVFFD